ATPRERKWETATVSKSNPTVSETELASYLEKHYKEEGELEEEVFKEIPRNPELLQDLLALIEGPMVADFRELENIVKEENMDYHKAESKLLKIESVFRGVGAKKLCDKVLMCLSAFENKRSSFFCLSAVEFLHEDVLSFKKVIERLIHLEHNLLQG
ncbi:hypothetical protein ACH5RR_000870, partial [Cinchona calisaya]